ncbi:MAG: hypothetical protein STSR0007_11920 [Thermovirga sp.]
MVRKQEKSSLDIGFESGGGASLGGPDTTRVSLNVGEDGINEVFFSHSNVEIVCEGTVYLK